MSISSHDFINYIASILYDLDPPALKFGGEYNGSSIFARPKPIRRGGPLRDHIHVRVFAYEDFGEYDTHFTDIWFQMEKLNEKVEVDTNDTDDLYKYVHGKLIRGIAILKCIVNESIQKKKELALDDLKRKLEEEEFNGQ